MANKLNYPARVGQDILGSGVWQAQIFHSSYQASKFHQILKELYNSLQWCKWYIFLFYESFKLVNVKYGLQRGETLSMYKTPPQIYICPVHK